jgi:acetyl esterase/lipase
MTPRGPNDDGTRSDTMQPSFRCVLASVCGLALLAPAVPAQPAAKDKPKPDVANAKYGPHERNVLDLWQAKSAKATPLVVFIHGGGFRGGSKENLNADLLDRCLKAGISVAAINYRLTDTAPYPATFLDSARAIQYLRSQAKEWNLDPACVAATGGSAGAGTSLWIGFHDDMADPKSNDPVARQSTRLTCMAVQGAQTTYDPRAIQKLIGGRAHEHPALMPFYGLKPDELDTPKAHKLYEEASAMTYVSKDDPPVFLFYSEPKGPLPADAKPGQGIHHPNFGIALKEKLDPLKIECILRHRDDYKGKDDPQGELHREMVEFFLKHFK